jgi:hypothetical protein
MHDLGPVIPTLALLGESTVEIPKSYETHPKVERF